MLDPLPLQAPKHDSESGVGYCLRVARLNGLNLHWLRQAAGIKYAKPLDGRYAPQLSLMLQCDEQALTDGLVTAQRWAGLRSWRFAGKTLLARNQLRAQHPQICPQCVHEQGFCRSVWELSLVTACTVHGCALVDECGRCGAQIRWDRPGVDICRCGRPFERNGPMAEKPHLELARLIESRLTGARDGSCRLPAFLTDLTLDGLVRLVHAFGEAAKEFAPISGVIHSQVRRTRDWMGIASRAHGRLLQLQHEEGAALTRLAPFVIAPILERLASHYVAEGDRQVALYLLVDLLGVVPSGRMNGKHEAFSQLPLFT